VRCIHLNPLRARLVEEIDNFDTLSWSGHGALMGKRNNPWQDIVNVLSLFGNKGYRARRAYRNYVEKASRKDAASIQPEGS
jgi:putative transposase